MPSEKFYLTEQGLKTAEKELEKFKELRKIKLGKETPSVLYSEELNTEFISFKEELDYLDAKIEELEYILKNYEIIKPSNSSENGKIVDLGCRVKLVEASGEEDEFLVVGTLEANPSLGHISNESPIGKALLGKKEGDEVVINSPNKLVYKIKSVSWSS